jgi:para-nitrobenzyl esterase
MFASTNYYLWDSLAAKSSVYAYWFTDVNAPNSFESPLLPMDATHMDEIQYVFGTIGARGGTAAQVSLSDEMIGYWTRFAKQGKPAATGWSAFSSGGLFTTVKKLDTPSSNTTSMNFALTHNCLFWQDPPLAAAE